LNAHCVECRFVSEIDWKTGMTPLSGHCPAGDINLINQNGGRSSLNQKRHCNGFNPSSDPNQAEKVEKKILEAEAVLEAFLHPHSSQLTSSSQVISENHQMQMAGSSEQQQAVDKNPEVENRPSTAIDAPGQSKSSSFSDRGAAGRANRANSQGPETRVKQ
jgi:hypothetical protein